MKCANESQSDPVEENRNNSAADQRKAISAEAAHVTNHNYLKSPNLDFYPHRSNIDHVKFIICRNCFWCASQLGENGPFMEEGNDDDNSSSNRNNNFCPNCSFYNVLEAIPISSNERFIIDNNEKRGLTLEFSQRPK